MNNKQKVAYKLIFLLIFRHFFQKIIKSITNLFSNIVPFSLAKCEERESQPAMSIDFFPQNYVFYWMEIRKTLLKQPIRIEYLIKQKPRAALALQVNRIAS